MAREGTGDRIDRRTAAYSAEHGLAWLLVLVALVMGAIGLLAGFGIIGANDAVTPATGGEGTDVVPQAVAENELVNWQEGMLWLLPAISIGLVSLAFHGSEHHTRRESTYAKEGVNKGMFNAEHGLAYISGSAAIGAAALGLLIGFDAFDNGYTFEDGMLWSMAGIITGVTTATLHAVTHHQAVADEDVIVRIIEERTATARTVGARGERTAERPRDITT